MGVKEFYYWPDGSFISVSRFNEMKDYNFDYDKTKKELSVIDGSTVEEIKQMINAQLEVKKEKT